MLGATDATVWPRFVASNDEIDQIERLLCEISRRYRQTDTPQFLGDVNVLAHELPRRLRLYINEMRLSENGSLFMVSGLPIDEQRLTSTPVHWRDRGEAGRQEEFFLVLCASLLGDVFGWATQQDGRLVNEVLPVQRHENQQLGTASAVELTWHTEDAFHPYRADYLGLLCLRNPQRVATTVCRLSDVGPTLTLPVLWETRFLIRPDNSHLPQHNSADVVDRGWDYFTRILEMSNHPHEVSVLYGSRTAPCWRIDPDFIDVRPGDEAAREALQQLIEAISESLFDVVLMPGDILFLDNHRAVHGRRPFRASYDGNDRWLKRINVTRDLRKSEDARGHPLLRMIGA